MAEQSRQRPDQEPALLDPRQVAALMRLEMGWRTPASSSGRRAIILAVLYALVGTMAGVLVAMLVLPLYALLTRPAMLLTLIAVFAAVGGFAGYRRGGG